MQSQLVSSHGMLAILEVLEGRAARDVNYKLLQIVNVVRLITNPLLNSLFILLNIAGHRGYGLLGELLPHWVCFGCCVSNPSPNVISKWYPRHYELHLEETPFRMSSRGIEVYSTPLPRVRSYVTDVHLVSTSSPFPLQSN